MVGSLSLTPSVAEHARPLMLLHHRYFFFLNASEIYFISQSPNRSELTCAGRPFSQKKVRGGLGSFLKKSQRAARDRKRPHKCLGVLALVSD
jgi:hypothetical protein